MLSINPQYIVDETQTQQAVIIKIKEWEEIVKRLEMLEDIENYDKAKKKDDEIIPFDQAVKEIRG